MKAKINKALDYSVLLEKQAQGKLLKKTLQFPLIAPTKYDGNYVVVEVTNGRNYFTTSGGLSYRHSDDGGDVFEWAVTGFYLAERIYGEGKLGARDKCNLTGPKNDQKSKGHTYKVFDCLSHKEYNQGYSDRPYCDRLEFLLTDSGIYQSAINDVAHIPTREKLDAYLKEVVNKGYEGLMLVQPDWVWRDTKSRTIDFCKYKKRRTADLLCVNWTGGEGKYQGLIGSLVLQDSEGREVSVGSGLVDELRQGPPSLFVGKVVEIEYERIKDTYIQPTFIRVRHDKTKEEID